MQIKAACGGIHWYSRISGHEGEMWGNGLITLKWLVICVTMDISLVRLAEIFLSEFRNAFLNSVKMYMKLLTRFQEAVAAKFRES